FLFEAADEEFALQAEKLLSRHVGWLTVQPFTAVQQLIPQDAESELLVMSHTVYTQLSEDESLWEQLPSMLVIRENKNGMEKGTL
ncbi:MAG: cation/H(+) antiporter, partial [Bacteroides sp.]